MCHYIDAVDSIDNQERFLLVHKKNSKTQNLSLTSLSKDTSVKILDSD